MDSLAVWFVSSVALKGGEFLSFTKKRLKKPKRVCVSKNKRVQSPESWILQETEEEQGVCLMIQNPSRMKTRIFFWALHQRLHICVFSSGFKDF